MISIPNNLRVRQLALAAAAALALAGCSKGSDDATAPLAAASAPVVAMAPAPVATPAPVVVAQNDNRTYEQGRRDAQRDAARRERERALPPRADRDGDVAPAHETDQQRWNREHQVAAAACANCGVVESVTAVTVQGQNNGVGAVAGGVGGALVGNKIAGRDNHALGGVIGAVGGALAGNAIEKHQRKSTAYDVSVRMSDGTLRTVRESTSPAVGEKVRVEADGLHARS
ncbi:MAG: glycine zipper 2TM domain-containing protein [Betaproteobacteria bacterium]